MTWNTGFNEAAAVCGLDAAALLALSGPAVEIAGHYWQRIGGRIQVCIGCAVWTVDAADVGGVQ